jgi:hypothetical protein
VSWSCPRKARGKLRPAKALRNTEAAPARAGLKARWPSPSHASDTAPAILSKRGGNSAIPTEVEVERDGDQRQQYQMRPVVLDEPNRPRAWEVLRRNRSGHWEPVEGQHLRPRSATSTGNAVRV